MPPAAKPGDGKGDRARSPTGALPRRDVTWPDTSLLAKMDFFLGVPGDTLGAARSAAQCEPLAKGAQIFEQGGRARRAYALAEGSVRIVQTGSDGAQVVVRFIAPGEMFGTVPLFTDHLFPADAVAAERSLVLSWSEADLLQLIGTCPRMALNVIKILGLRLAEAQDRVRELSTQGVERRVAHALLRLAAQAGTSGLGGTAIRIPLRRKDLAGISGTTLHTASRILTAWQKAGLIVSDHQYLTLVDLSGIRRIAEDPAF